MTDSLDPEEALEVESSALDSTPTSPPARPQESAPPTSVLRSVVTPSPPSFSADTSAAPSRTPRRRLLIVASLFALLAALLSALLLIPPENRTATLALLGGPTLTPMRILEPGDDLFLWEHSVPWGSLFIDGQPGPDVHSAPLHADTSGATIGAPFHLSRGRHTLQYRAPPFPTLTCIVSVPATFADTCPLDPSNDVSSLIPAAPTTRLLDLQASVDYLPPTQFQALVDATQAALTTLAASYGSGMIAVGDHYRDLSWEIRQATAPLMVEPQYRLTTPINGDPDCYSVCGNTDLVATDPSTDWIIHALVALNWRYTTADGQAPIPAGPATAYEMRRDTLLSLVTQWRDGRWQPPTPVIGTPRVDPIICGVGDHYREALQAAPGQSTVNQQFQWSFASSTAELGCVFAGSQREPSTGKPSGPIVLVLYHAGALVAVNAEAQRVFPTLPIASPHERTLANAVAPSQLG